MDKWIFWLCALTAFFCAVLLIRSYSRKKIRLHLWSGVCFVLLSLSNVLIIADRWIFPEISLMVPRLLASLVGVVLLIYGLIWESE